MLLLGFPPQNCPKASLSVAVCKLALQGSDSQWSNLPMRSRLENSVSRWEARGPTFNKFNFWFLSARGRRYLQEKRVQQKQKNNFVENYWSANTHIYCNSVWFDMGVLAFCRLRTPKLFVHACQQKAKHAPRKNSRRTFPLKTFQSKNIFCLTIALVVNLNHSATINFSISWNNAACFAFVLLAKIWVNYDVMLCLVSLGACDAARFDFNQPGLSKLFAAN